MTSRSALIFFVCLALLPSGQCQGFLSKPKTDSVRDELKGVLSEAMEGYGCARSRLARIRATLLPLFRSLPKNAQGHLSTPAMRYAVRRYFSQQHAWVVKGFEPHAELVDTSASEDVLQGKIPAYIRSVLEEKFAHNGFALEDVITMVAAVERLAFDEVVRNVEECFWLNDRSVMDPLNRSDMMEVLSSYLITSMFGGSTDKAGHMWDKKHIDLRYPQWSETFLFLTDVSGSDNFQRIPSSNMFVKEQNPFGKEQQFFFHDVIRVAERVNEEFGPWSNHECQHIKELLVDKDVYGSGRVRLADFYRPQDGAWEFTEQSEYLRQLGALDESSPSSGPQVLIPNYVTGLSNCITSKPYYAICCLNECDQIYQHLEASTASETASSREIIEAIESLPQPPNISAQLRVKLDEVAQQHNGNAPLHGRLVAQWLHFAFPHECPYPHEAGTISPKLSAEWEAEHGEEADSMSEAEIKHVLELDAGLNSVSLDDAFASWTPKESLIDQSDSVWPHRLRIFVQLTMLISCFAVVVRQASHVVPPAKKAFDYDV